MQLVGVVKIHLLSQILLFLNYDILSRIKKKKFVKLFIKIFAYWNIIFCHKMIWKRV